MLCSELLLNLSFRYGNCFQLDADSRSSLEFIRFSGTEQTLNSRKGLSGRSDSAEGDAALLRPRALPKVENVLKFSLSLFDTKGYYFAGEVKIDTIPSMHSCKLSRDFELNSCKMSQYVELYESITTMIKTKRDKRPQKREKNIK